MSDLWVHASADHAAEEADRRFVEAKGKATQYWGFLAAAKSKADYEARKAVVSERLEKVVSDTALRNRVLASWDADYATVSKSSRKTSAITYNLYYTLYHSVDSPYNKADAYQDVWQDSITIPWGGSGSNLSGFSEVEGHIQGWLNTIYARHNRDDRPDGQYVRSLSMGDVIGTEWGYWKVDRVGFSKTGTPRVVSDAEAASLHDQTMRSVFGHDWEGTTASRRTAAWDVAPGERPILVIDDRYTYDIQNRFTSEAMARERGLDLPPGYLLGSGLRVRDAVVYLQPTGEFSRGKGIISGVEAMKINVYSVHTEARDGEGSIELVGTVGDFIATGYTNAGLLKGYTGARKTAAMRISVLEEDGKLLLFSGQFSDTYEGEAVWNPQRKVYEVSLYDGQTFDVSTSGKRNNRNFRSVDAAIGHHVNKALGDPAEHPYMKFNIGSRIANFARDGDFEGYASDARFFTLDEAREFIRTNESPTGFWEIGEYGRLPGHAGSPRGYYVTSGNMVQGLVKQTHRITSSSSGVHKMWVRSSDYEWGNDAWIDFVKENLEYDGVDVSNFPEGWDWEPIDYAVDADDNGREYNITLLQLWENV